MLRNLNSAISELAIVNATIAQSSRSTINITCVAVSPRLLIKLLENERESQGESTTTGEKQMNHKNERRFFPFRRFLFASNTSHWWPNLDDHVSLCPTRITSRRQGATTKTNELCSLSLNWFLIFRGYESYRQRHSKSSNRAYVYCEKIMEKWKCSRCREKTFQSHPPPKLIIYWIRDKFNDTCSMLGAPWSSRPTMTCMEKNKDTVAASMVESPITSTRCCSLEFGDKQKITADDAERIEL